MHCSPNRYIDKECLRTLLLNLLVYCTSSVAAIFFTDGVIAFPSTSRMGSALIVSTVIMGHIVGLLLAVVPILDKSLFLPEDDDSDSDDETGASPQEDSG